MSIRITTAIDIGADEGVERDTDGAPIAWRIWKKGENPTDKGMTVFSEDSAKLLLEQQTARGNLFSIDVDHLSLSPVAPPEARKAVGFHRIEVRDGELWAVDVEWTDTVRAGLIKRPPEWRYYSPAYDVHKESREVMRYLNTALTNNPATWNATELASQVDDSKNHASLESPRKTSMTLDDMKAALKAMAEGSDEKCASMAKAALAAFEPKPEAGEGEGEEKPKAEPEAATSSSSAPSSAEIRLAATVAEQGRELAKLKAERENEKRATLLAGASDALRAALASESPEKIEKILAALPKAPAGAAELSAVSSATRGSESVTGGHLPPSQKAALDVAMGLVEQETVCERDGAVLRLGVLKPKSATSAANEGK